VKENVRVWPLDPFVSEAVGGRLSETRRGKKEEILKRIRGGLVGWCLCLGSTAFLASRGPLHSAYSGGKGLRQFKKNSLGYPYWERGKSSTSFPPGTPGSSLSSHWGWEGTTEGGMLLEEGLIGKGS